MKASYGIQTVTVDQVAASRVAREATYADENPVYNLTLAGSAAG